MSEAHAPSEVTRTQMGVGIERLRTHEYTLEVVDGPDKGKSLRTRGRVIRLGTSPENEFEVDDGTTSRFHARIEADLFGHRLTDNDSKNGTFLGDVRIRDVYLNPGALIRIGGNTFRYQPGSEAVEIELSRATRFGRIIGQSAAMREIFAILERVGPTDMTILVEGESGTGKELVAEAVHQHSKRKDGPLVVFDCSAVAPNLIESELFGHVKGAFTGAVVARAGAFERAQGGTLFLDEMGELPLDLQPKLLRALEQREFKPVGADRAVKLNTRIVAATNRNLQKEVEAGNFREDLYYRLAVIRVVLPPLRRRVDDIPLLVGHFLKELQTPDGQPVQVSYETIVKLQKHKWPGNVRELRNFVERAAMLATGNRLETKYLVPPSFGDTRSGAEASAADEPAVAPAAALEGKAVAEFDDSLPFKDAKARLIDTFERTYWARLLDRTRGNISAAARIAGVHRKSAEYTLKKLNLRGAADGDDDGSSG
ncbi:sigma 54-interacting transcriptional regulator [Myxococcota bacterium]|nr:sigma 54-interacting transcriptional regulator [Myxococcota bacterium]